MPDSITIVTVTIVGDDNITACHCHHLAPFDSLEEIVDSVKEEALSAYSSYGGSLVYRVVVNVNKVPVPRIAATVVNADVPEGAEDAMVTAIIS